MLKKLKYTLLIFFVIPVISTTFSQIVATRTPFDIPLVKISTSAEKEDLHFRQVRISINENKEYAVITKLNDRHVKITRKGKEKTVYAEPPGLAHMLSYFEKKHLGNAVQSLISTLIAFEKDLDNKQWSKCLYLDSFFPRFLKGFYYLNCAAINSLDALPRQSMIQDAWYDVSLTSEKSEIRVEKWIHNRDYTIKLRIATRELIYQLKNWQKKELRKYKENPNVEFSQALKETYCLFVKLYFNKYYTK